MNNPKEVFTSEYYDNYQKLKLSRTFCNLILRENVVSHKPELEQICEFIGVDIFEIHVMTAYNEDYELRDIYLYKLDSFSEIEKIWEENGSVKSLVGENINRVYNVIENLILSLTKIDNLTSKLIKTNFDSLGNDYYFSKFNDDLENKFGQDLRNFKRFLEFAKSKGTKTVWFGFG